jgi:hypothetical protein
MHTPWLERVVIVGMKEWLGNGVTVGGLVHEGDVEKVVVGEGGTIEQRTPEVTARKESFSRDGKLCRCEDISAA